MRDPETTNGLTMSWVPVVDARGRTHMEAHWVTSSPASAAPPVPAQATPLPAHAA